MELATNKSYLWLLLILLIGCKEKDSSSSYSTFFMHDSDPVMVPKDSTKLMRTVGLVYYRNEPFTGVTAVHLPNGTLVESNAYKSGKRDGFFKKWFDDGTLSFESRYVNGKRDEKTQSWWGNGNLRSMSNFENGIAQGVQMQWYQSGAKFKQITLVDGKEQGMQKSWRENGKIYNNYEAKNGRIYGLKKSTLCFQLEDEQLRPGS